MEHGGAVVVVACVGGDNAGVDLVRKRTNYVREWLVRQPTHAVIRGLASPLSITRHSWVALYAELGLALVLPRGKEAAICGNRQAGLPLGAGSVIGVQLKWRAEGHAAVRRADVEDVAGIAVAGVSRGIDVVNYVVKGGGLSRTAGAPVGRTATGIHAGKVTRTSTPARSRESGAGVGERPSVTAIG